MKKIGILFAALAVFMVGNRSFAGDLMQEIMVVHAKNVIAAEMQAKNVINWHVGEHAEYKIALMGMMEIGQMKMRADREEGNALWVVQEMTGMQQQKAEMLIDRATGKTLKYVVNGQEQAPPADGQIDIISQDEQQVTVPAGTFDTVHIVANPHQDQVKQMEIWVNMRDLVLSGMAQTKIDTTQGMSIMVQLVSFGH